MEPQALPWLLSGDLVPVNALSSLCLQCSMRVRDLRRGSSLPCSLPCGQGAAQPMCRGRPRGKGFPRLPATLSGQLSCLRQNLSGIQCQDTSPSNKNYKGRQEAILLPKMIGGGDGAVPVIQSQANQSPQQHVRAWGPLSRTSVFEVKS